MHPSGKAGRSKSGFSRLGLFLSNQPTQQAVSGRLERPEANAVMKPEQIRAKTDTRPEYASPSISTLREDEVLEEVGPAQAYTGNLPFGF